MLLWNNLLLICPISYKMWENYINYYKNPYNWIFISKELIHFIINNNKKIDIEKIELIWKLIHDVQTAEQSKDMIEHQQIQFFLMHYAEGNVELSHKQELEGKKWTLDQHHKFFCKCLFVELLYLTTKSS